jgi:hypothetical protein
MIDDACLHCSHVTIDKNLMEANHNNVIYHIWVYS